MALRKRILPVSEKRVKEVIVEFLGNDYVFYRPLAASTKQTVMLTQVAKQIHCITLTKGNNGYVFAFYETEGDAHMRKTCAFDLGKIPESQRKALSDVPIAVEITDLHQKFRVMFACQQAYTMGKKLRKASREKFRLI